MCVCVCHVYVYVYNSIYIYMSKRNLVGCIGALGFHTRYRLTGDDSHPQLQVSGMGFATIGAVQVVQSLESSTMAMYDILESLENMPSTSSIYPFLSYLILSTKLFIYLSIYLSI